MARCRAGAFALRLGPGVMRVRGRGEQQRLPPGSGASPCSLRGGLGCGVPGACSTLVGGNQRRAVREGGSVVAGAAIFLLYLPFCRGGGVGASCGAAAECRRAGGEGTRLWPLVAGWELGWHPGGLLPARCSTRSLWRFSKFLKIQNIQICSNQCKKRVRGSFGQLLEFFQAKLTLWSFASICTRLIQNQIWKNSYTYYFWETR